MPPSSLRDRGCAILKCNPLAPYLPIATPRPLPPPVHAPHPAASGVVKDMEFETLGLVSI